MNVNFKSLNSNADPYFNNVSLLLHMNGTSGSKNFIDSSLNNIQSTAVGNIELSTSTKKFGSASARLYGAGGGNYLNISGNQALAMGTGDYTVEMWVYLNNNNTFPIYDSAPPGSSSMRLDSFLFYIENNREPRFLGNGNNIITSINSFPINEWGHLALVRNAGTTTIYINGSGAANSTGFYNDTLAVNGCIIGAFLDNLNFDSNGFIDEFRITKGVARYTGNFIPPTAEFLDTPPRKSLFFGKSNDGKKTLLRPVNLPTPITESDPYINNVSLLLHMDGISGSQNFIDSSLNNFTLTASGNSQINTNIKKFGNGSARFDGNGDFISISSNSNLAMSTGDFTIEFWIYPLNWNSALSDSIINFNGPNGITIGMNGSLQFGVGNSFISWELVGATPSLNEWSHVAVTRNAGYMRIFINGSITAQNTIITNYSQPFNCIGGLPNSSWSYFNGYLDEIRVTKGIARYTGTFTPPTQPFPNS